MAVDRIRETLSALTRQAEAAGSDHEKLMEVLSKTVEVAEGAEGALTLSKRIIEQALLAGVHPRDLYDRPFSGTYVRGVYNELRDQGHDLPELTRSGPRRSRREKAS